MTKSTGKWGLSSPQAKDLQKQFGKNELSREKKQSLFKKILIIISEPMFLLLLVSALIYFFLGEPRDGMIMLVFVIGMMSIDIFQELKTDKTISALKDLSAPKVKVFRDFQECEIDSIDLVPGDVMIIHEGVKIPADGFVVSCNDLCVNESTLTGETEGVWKIINGQANQSNDYWRKDYCYAGTLVIQGSGYIEVDKIGMNTEYGKIGKDIDEVKEEPTPLQKQTKALVRSCAIIALLLFILVTLITWFNSNDLVLSNRLISSILAGITLAMAMIPEEFPVVLTVFLSLGAWRLAKKNSLVRKLPSVETLGAVSVLCVDKTGTITQNEMAVQTLWSLEDNNHTLLEVVGKACEYPTYDPMEEAILNYCHDAGFTREVLFHQPLVDEYSFTNETKMMGHIWQEESIHLCAKGSPESILKLCPLDLTQLEIINQKINELSSNGFRLLAVGEQSFVNQNEIPSSLEECQLQFLGLIALMDPPRKEIADSIKVCKEAGIRVVMITGDNGITAKSIAEKVGININGEIVTGEEIDQLSDSELQNKIKETTIFSRVIPAHKMRIVKAFKNNGEIVAMTGDGVNDAPALKIADIGIAMGKRGSEVSREAADLILMDDNFSTIVDTIHDGRRIYENIRKAIQYIFIIHIPIALSALLGPLLKIDSTALFLLPLHVVLLELIIDPTCSIVLERQPAEDDVMKKSPRDPKANILTKKLLFKSIFQGLIIFIASFGTYYYYYKYCNNVLTARAMGLTILIFSNLLLVYVNSSTHESFIHTLKKLKHDKVMMSSSLITLLLIFIILYTPLYSFLKLTPLSFYEFAITIIISLVSVLWYEIYKLVKYKK